MKPALPIIIWCLCFCMSIGQNSLKGAWQLKAHGDPGEVASMIITEHYMTVAVYNESDHSFIRSYGGAINLASIGHKPGGAQHNGKVFLKLEFDTKDTTKIGTDIGYDFTIQQDKLTLKQTIAVEWSRVDDGMTPLSGCWRITDRIGSDGVMSAMASGPRKTIKMLSGTRFQWFAINPVTKQFSGTGGGTYTLKDGKYMEQIQFFSRDKTRVGSSLSFDAKITGGKWDHRGTSSTGNPVHEIWTKQ